jgi:hypothetical protein
MSTIRSDAARAGTVEAAAAVFGTTFDLCLQDLIAVYRMPIWKHSSYGGNKWAEICSQVWHLVCTMESGNEFEAEKLYREVMAMYHNTGGTVAEKLHSLKS